MKAHLCMAVVIFASAGNAEFYTPPGEVAHWSANGTAIDNIGGHNGNLYNASYAQGVFGQAFNITPSQSRVYVPDSSAFATPSFTLTGWVNPRARFGHLLVRGDARPGLDTYTLSLAYGSDLTFGFNTAANGYTSIAASIALNTWTHFAASFDDATGAMNLYLNGNLLASKITGLRPVLQLTGSMSGIGIGNVPDTINDFNISGLVDEVGIFSRALSAGEIAQMVPEPSALSLTLLGGLMIARPRRK